MGYFYKYIALVIFQILFGLHALFSQELNARVTVNHQQIQRSNVSIFKTLENSLYEFLNNTRWTGARYAPQERIECNFTLILELEPSPNEFQGKLQIQYSRPAFGTSYNSPVINYQDVDIYFPYTEFERLEFNPQNVDNNLVAIMAFYAYMIIGFDNATFAPGAGKEQFEMMQNIVNFMQSQGRFPGWRDDGRGFRNRFWIAEHLNHSTTGDFLQALYTYHRLGIDVLHSNSRVKEGKEKISEALMSLQPVYKKRPQSILLQIFFQAKADEIAGIFSGGEPINTVNLRNVLNEIDPLNSAKYAQLK
ncbi:hypothetical protein JCM31826_17420 [Thermaurantimonas aggregans]|uniref:DUF4835 domain-containing protein n=1 Tax=Thermaurantimonas aggregans TaxID=2173829 RepID=A0A401XML6_9FLAO|nr:DUF4835 family protein [Thermaurantimonas aggregans]MCX8147715.1 DUF4835 family protein [Thermaurantimonas aggregans]GCD78260.1 hypothetical protein JCM31826_17420 [Thermaurantimonas aggregans]